MRDSILMPLTVFGPFFSVQFSETRGRRKVFIVALSGNSLLTGLTALSRNLTTLFVLRLFAGLWGGFVFTVAPATINDLWETGHGSSFVGIVITCMPFLGVAIGSFAGGWVVWFSSDDWRWLFYFACCVSCPILVLACTMPETSVREMRRRIREMRGLPREDPTELKPHFFTAWYAVSLITVFRPLYMLAMEPIVGLLSLHIAVAYGIFFYCFENFAEVFRKHHHFNSWQIGCTSLAMAVGAILAAVTFRIMVLSTATGRKPNAEGERPPPEARLYPAMLGSVFLLTIIWCAWTANPEYHWSNPLVGVGLFTYGTLLLIYGTISYHLDTYDRRAAASAIAANGIVRNIFAAGFPPVIRTVNNALGYRWTGIILGCITAIFIPVPWLLFRYGRQLRQRSCYPTFDDDGSIVVPRGGFLDRRSSTQGKQRRPSEPDLPPHLTGTFEPALPSGAARPSTPKHPMNTPYSFAASGRHPSTHALSNRGV